LGIIYHKINVNQFLLNKCIKFQIYSSLIVYHIVKGYRKTQSVYIKTKFERYWDFPFLHFCRKQLTIKNIKLPKVYELNSFILAITLVKIMTTYRLDALLSFDKGHSYKLAIK
jgi:hypothetical protein